MLLDSTKGTSNMINKFVSSVSEALADTADGATVMIGGFGTAGIPDDAYFAALSMRLKRMCSTAAESTRTRRSYELSISSVIAAVAMTLLTHAYRLANANLVTVFEYTGMIWSVLYGWMFWRQWPDATA